MDRSDYQEGPRFVRYYEPVLSALRQLGGSARPAEVKDRVAVDLGVTDENRAEELSSGQSRFDNLLAWARFYLVKAGYIDSSRRGVWTLTDKGRTCEPLSHDAALQLFREQHSKFTEARRISTTGQQEDEAEVIAPRGIESVPTSDYREAVISLLRSLSPSGFEQFCQRLLRESGFQEVTITGRSGDEGIDGIGVLQMNPLVSFKVLFQCKKYKESVSSPHVRNFRGAMMGRADKGIIITTGTFTTDARREAMRDGVPPIELVDREKLVDMLEALELGLKPVRGYRIDDDFFDDFLG
ncbi:MAG TPA: restriction endonuclease [Planctomycetota bacterium]|nr:restriction endonuclease [Planctomycetota bacterium]